jgi:HK97 family phage prohead protease
MHYKSLQLKDATIDMGARTITAYSAAFSKDQGDDIIMPGAFKKTISERLDRIKVLRNHDMMLGKAMSAVEDGYGLKTVSYIGKHALGEETLILAKDGILDSMSIGYSIPQGKSSEDADGTRIITEMKLIEWSVVDFAMNEDARILDVKSLERKLKSGNITLDELNRLSVAIDELKALLTVEPPKGTHAELQPQELAELKSAVEFWANIGRT